MNQQENDSDFGANLPYACQAWFSFQLVVLSYAPMADDRW
jgi:hypothetical protein